MSDPVDATELYQAIIDDHRRRPRHRRTLPTAHRVASAENPLCGDTCTVHLQFDPAPANPSPLAPATRIVAATFTGAGCALSQASASLATVALTGLTPAQALALAATIETLVRNGHPSSEPAPEATVLSADSDLRALAAVHALPARHPCALLIWQATRQALSSPQTSHH